MTTTVAPALCIPWPALRLLTACVLLPLAASFAATQNVALDRGPAGEITGTVSNAATGANLEGAQLMLEPGGLSTLAARDGQFHFAQVPAGEYSLVVSYTGLDTKAVPVTVAPRGTAISNVGLSSEVYRLSPFVVPGEREGNALAITQQRHAPNIKNVISSDAFGNVADQNLGNFLLRVPSVSKEEDEGAIFRVRIRGINSNMSSVSIDGTRGASGSTRSYDRGFEIDKIPADFIETIEVTKAMTPDMDADSIGGAVNLKTKSAFNRQGRLITYQFGQSYNPQQGTFRPMASLSFSDRFGPERRLGALLTSSYSESHKPRQRSEIRYEALADTSQPAHFNITQRGEDRLKHTRAGLGFRLDYKLTENTSVYFNTMYSLFKDQLVRRVSGMGNIATANLVSVSETVTETRNQTFTYNQNHRERDIRTLNFTTGGESKLWGGKIDFSASYSPSEGTERRLIPTRTVGGVGFRQDRSESRSWIRLTQISGPDVTDPRNATFTVDMPDVDSKDRIAGGQLNLRLPLDVGVPATLKTGFRFRTQNREKDEQRRQFSYIGPNGVPGPLGAANDDDIGRLYDTGYNYSPVGHIPVRYFNQASVQEALRTTPNFFRQDLAVSVRDSTQLDTRVSEDVGALYLMGDTRFGRLGVVGGVRMEQTRVRGYGHKQEITPAERARRLAFGSVLTPEETIRRTLAEYDNPTSGSSRYRDFFPSVHLKYLVAKDVIARASFSTGIGRPNFGQIVPDLTVNNELMTLSANNPALRPQYADNYDLSLEYYFEPAGLLSVGVFRKDIRDFIFSLEGETLGSGNVYGDAYTGYRLTTDANGGSARVEGLEFAYSQQFSKLSGFLRAFGAFANFTWLQSEGNYGTTSPQAALTNFTPRSGNVGLSYIAHGWTIRTKMNYHSVRLSSFNANPAQRVYFIANKPVDLNIAYAVNPRLSVFMDVINIFNTPTQQTYTFVPDRKFKNDTYTAIIQFGVSGRF